MNKNGTFSKKTKNLFFSIDKKVSFINLFEARKNKRQIYIELEYLLNVDSAR